MASKEVTLNVKERIYATSLLRMWKGDVMAEGAKILDDAKQIVLSDEERDAIELKQDGPTLTWNAAKENEAEKTLTLQSETINYFISKMKERDDAKETTFDEIPLVQSLRANLE